MFKPSSTKSFMTAKEKANLIPVSAIVNLDDSEGHGTHWVAFVDDPRLPFIDYFDSFGQPPPQELITFFAKLGKPFLYNSSQLQEIKSDYCGYYVAYYIAQRAKGLSPQEVLYSMTQHPSKANEQLVSSYKFPSRGPAPYDPALGGMGKGGDIEAVDMHIGPANDGVAENWGKVLNAPAAWKKLMAAEEKARKKRYYQSTKKDNVRRQKNSKAHQKALQARIRLMKRMGQPVY